MSKQIHPNIAGSKSLIIPPFKREMAVCHFRRTKQKKKKKASRPLKPAVIKKSNVPKILNSVVSCHQPNLNLKSNFFKILSQMPEVSSNYVN